MLFTGDPSGAAKEFQLAKRLFPTDPDILHALGLPYFAQHRYEQALAKYEESVVIEGRHAEGYHVLGLVHQELGMDHQDPVEFLKAIDCFEKEASLRGKDDEGAKHYFEALRRAVQEGGAEGYWRKALEFSLRASTPNPYRIAYCYARLREKDQAYKFLEKAIDERTYDVIECLMFDPGWDRNDDQFKRLARKAGLIW